MSPVPPSEWPSNPASWDAEAHEKPIWARVLALGLERLGLPGGWIRRLDDTLYGSLATQGLDPTRFGPAPCLFKSEGLEAGAVLQVCDARDDPQLAGHPWVAGPSGLRFFLQQPLSDRQGRVWGVLCAFDTEVRRLDPDRLQGLGLLVPLAQAIWDASQHPLRHMTSLVPAAIYQFRWQPGGQTSFPFASQAFGQLFGLEPDSLRLSSAPMLSLVHPQDQAMLRHSIAASRADLSPWSLAFRCVGVSGQVEWFHGQSRPVQEPDGSVLWHGFFINISDQKKAELELREAETRWKFALEGSAAGVWDWNLVTDETYFSPQYRQLYGYSDTDDIFDADGTHRVHPEDREKAWAAREAHFQGLTPLYRSEHRSLCRDGRWKWILSRGLVVERDEQGRPVRMIGTHTDISERKQADVQAHHMAYYDSLTGLPNRALLLRRLSEWLQTRPEPFSGALVHVDLDGFKRFNHARGHGMGDALLRGVAERLREHLPQSAFLARLAADEFVALLPRLAPQPGQTPRQQAWTLGDGLRVVLLAPLSLEAHHFSITVTASVGVTVFPDPGLGSPDPEGLLREADAAMNHAKSLGANRVAAFEAAMQTAIEHRYLIEEDLKSALVRGELSAHVQTQFDARRRIMGAELLMRWTHPVRGSVSPADFIPVAETSGLIVSLGEWMLERAAEALLTLDAAGQTFPLSVNVSPSQFRQVDFVPRVEAILRRSGAPADRLIFEITEGVLLDRSDSVQAQMNQLMALGIRFSIDDFGTGFSSLGYLKRLPIHEIKIDRSFVNGIPDDEGDAAIVRSVLLMARQFRLQVIAEGVENSRQVDFLTAHGCEGLQGFFLARPAPLEDWLRQFPAQA